MDIARLYEFDIKLRDAVEEVELPDEWNMVNPGKKKKNYRGWHEYQSV